MITGNAIITDLSTMGVPWADLDISNYLDIMYYAHSANKIVSPIVKDLVIADDNDNYSLSANSRTTLAKIIAIQFNDKWTKLWTLNEIEYNPLSNDSQTISETYSATSENEIANTGTITTDKDGTNSGTVVTDRDSTDTGTISNNRDITNTGTVNDSGNVSQSDGIYGFNSSSSVGNTTMSGTDGNTRTDNLRTDDDNTETRNLANTEDTTETRNLANTEDTTETRNLATNEASTNSYTKEITSEGVRGVMVQELIESERNILQWNFWNVVFNDIDSFLALDIY